MKQSILAVKLITVLFFISISASGQRPQNIESSLMLLNVQTGQTKVILNEKRHFEAPNWSRDGKYLIINSKGFLEKIDLEGNNLGKIRPDIINNCNNDHGLSFDGKTLIFSRNDKEVAPRANSRIYTFSFETEEVSQVTPKFPSYWHGISPDDQTLVYFASRNGQKDIYSINIQGGEEKQLTNSPAYEDGPEYSYDGQWIYFNSHRTGRMQLYRMKPDGSQQEQLTNDDYDNWFAHPSPDGEYIVYISYLKDQKGRHPFGQDVKLRVMQLKNREIKDLTPVFYGGQGTINVPSWSPDGEWIAYVQYRQ